MRKDKAEVFVIKGYKEFKRTISLNPKWFSINVRDFQKETLDPPRLERSELRIKVGSYKLAKHVVELLNVQGKPNEKSTKKTFKTKIKVKGRQKNRLKSIPLIVKWE